MKLISKSVIKQLMKKYNINPVYNVNYMQYAASIELEHKDLIGNDPDKAFRIAMDHLREFPSYYIGLKKMERDLEEYWATRQKPHLTL